MWRRQHALLCRISPVTMAAQSPAAGAYGGPRPAHYGSSPQERKGKAAPLQVRGMVDRFQKRSMTAAMAASAKSAPGLTAKAGLTVEMEKQKASRGGKGLSKNQIGTRGSDKVAQVEGSNLLFTVNKPTRSLDPWDIPDAAEHSAASSNQMNNKDSINGNEAERGSSNQWEKQTYYSTCSKAGFPNTEDCNVSSIPHHVEMDEKDQFENEDEEFWEDEDDVDAEEDAKREEEDVQYAVAELTKPGQRLIVARGGEGGLGNASIGKDMGLSKEKRQEEIARLSTGQPGTETFLVLELKSIADVGLVGLPCVSSHIQTRM